ncbi:hypothetical protein D9M71_386520 [compost metagenome]
MLDHAPGFFGVEVQPVLPQVTVFQAAIFREFLLIGHQGEQAGVATHQALPGIENAVVVTFDIGPEVDRIAEQGGVVLLHFGLVDAQQRMAEHRGGTVEVGRGKNHHCAVGRYVFVPVVERLAVHPGQVVELQLLTQPARARRVDALRMLVAKAGRGIERLQGRAELACRLFCAVAGEKELRVVDVTAPTAELAGFIMAERDPVRGAGQLL